MAHDMGILVQRSKFMKWSRKAHVVGHVVVNGNVVGHVVANGHIVGHVVGDVVGDVVGHAVD